MRKALLPLAAAAAVCATGIMPAASGAVLSRSIASGAGAAAPRRAAAAPRAPFLAAVAPEGLGALASWAPDPAAEHVTGYVLKASVAKGYTGPVGTGCGAPPAVTAPGSDSAALVGGLCQQVPYTITVTAVNAAGASAPSNPSNPVVPLAAQPPSQPLLGPILGREQSLAVTWTPPDETGGKPLTGYTLTATAGAQTVTLHPAASAASAVVTGLTDAVAYQVSLTASSQAGTSAAATGTGTPSAPYVPRQPQNLQVAPSGSGGLAVSWLAPADNGGDAITGYSITYQQEVPASGGGWQPSGSPATVTAGASATRYTITGVDAQKFYSVQVAAVSAAGSGQAAQTAQPVTPTTGLAPGAVLLTRATMAALGSDASGVLTWPAPAPTQVAALAPGNVVVGPAAPAAPQGLLAKVVSVSKTGAGGYAVRTTLARLTDAFANLAVAEAGQPAQLQSPRFTPALPGVRLLAPAGRFTLQKTINFGLTLQGGPDNRDRVGLALTVTPEVSFDMQISHGFAGIPDGVSVAASASVAAQFNVTASLNAATEKWQFGTLTFPPIPIGPLEVTPTVPLTLQASGTISVGVSWSVAFGGGLSWSTSDPGTLNTQDLSQPFHLTGSPLPGVAASASAQAELQADVAMLVYDVGGPDIEVDAGLKATVNFNPPAGTPWFKLGPFVQGKIGLEVNFSIGPLSYDNKLQLTLARQDFPAFTIGSPPTADLTVSPSDPTVTAGKSLQFSAVRSDGQKFAVSWALEGGESGDSITSGGLLTVAPPGGRTLTVVAFDSQGAQGQTQVLVGGESDPPASVSAALGADGKTATVAWQPPAHTGGYPLASYTVATSPATAAVTVPATTTSVHLTGLALGTLYQVMVYATNGGNLTSPPGTADLATPLPGTLTGISALRAPLPANAAANPQVSLTAISCPAPGACIAVGGYLTKAKLHEGLIETEAGGTWTPREAPLPGNASTSSPDVAGLASVACPTATFCMATGYYRTSGSDQYLIEHLSGHTWTPSAAPQPSNIAPHLTSAPAMGATQFVSCPATSACFDVAFYLDSKLVSHFLTERWSGGGWKVAGVALPANAQDVPQPQPTLAGLACPSTTRCFAVGTYLTKDGSSMPVALTFSAGTWKSAEAPLPADASADPETTMAGLSCPSAAFCVAVGTYETKGVVSGNGSTGLIERFSAGTWTARGAPVPPDTYSPQYTDLPAVSCPAAGLCEGAGSYGSVNTSEQGPLTETLASGLWAPGADALPLNDAGGWGAASDLACPPAGCVVLGAYGATNDVTEVYVHSLAAGIPIPAPLPAGANKTPNPVLTPGGLACPAGGGCAAIGTYTDANGHIQGFIETLGLAQ